MSQYEAESEPYSMADESGDDWLDRDEECTCHFSGDQADTAGCFAHDGYLRTPDYRPMEPIREVVRRNVAVQRINEKEVA